jgi:hypothetical protein
VHDAIREIWQLVDHTLLAIFVFDQHAVFGGPIGFGFKQMLDFLKITPLIGIDHLHIAIMSFASPGVIMGLGNVAHAAYFLVKVRVSLHLLIRP